MEIEKIKKIKTLKKGDTITYDGIDIVCLDHDTVAVNNGGGVWVLLAKEELIADFIESLSGTLTQEESESLFE